MNLIKPLPDMGPVVGAWVSVAGLLSLSIQAGDDEASRAAATLLAKFAPGPDDRARLAEKLPIFAEDTYGSLMELVASVLLGRPKGEC